MHLPVIGTHTKQHQKDHCSSKARLICIERNRPTIDVTKVTKNPNKLIQLVDFCVGYFVGKNDSSVPSKQ